LDIQKIPASQIKAAKYNPRKDLSPGDSEYEKLRRSIEEFGYVEPVIWNRRTGNIVGGHQRYKVLMALGYKEIDCVVLDIDEQKEKALNVALNKITGEFDIPMLTDLLRDLNQDGFDVSLTGFDAAELDALFRDDVLGGIKEDAFDEPPPENPISRPGDLWLLGPHRLVCGDSTKAETFTPLMDGKKADLVVTDPPYNVAYEGSAGTIQNGNMESAKFHAFLLAAYRRMYENLEDGGSIYVFHADRETVNFRTAFTEAGFFCHQTRSQAAEVAAEFLNGRIENCRDSYDTKKVHAPDGRAWRFMSDGSIRGEVKVNGRRISAGREYSVELVSPVLTYREDIETLQELVRKLRRAGAFTNPSCGIHYGKRNVMLSYVAFLAI